MCGLLGTFTNSQPGESLARMEAGLELLRHRGPDDHGLEKIRIGGAFLFLGHTRLSIIDLSSGAHQPMRSADGRYTIVFNGEVYNYRELRVELLSLGEAVLGDSDTTVLLACWARWGIACLSKLRGMFAFCVYDKVENTLTCVRDAFGIKPFYYRPDPCGFIFASELPVMLQLVPQRPYMDFQSAYDYLVWGRYEEMESTFYDGISRLMPGHYLIVDLGKNKCAKQTRWWWPSTVEKANTSFESAVEEMRELFLDSIRLHLRSDVPVGAALSGGVDSSAIVCAMRYLEPDRPIHTFSYLAPGSSVDEGKWAGLVNDYVGAIAHSASGSGEGFASDLDELIRVQGEPVGSSSIYAQRTVYRMAREAGVTVVLDGQGADELLAGYSGYPAAYLQSLIQCRRYSEIVPFLHKWAGWPDRGIKEAVRALGSALIPHKMTGLAYSALGRNPIPEWLIRSELEQVDVRMSRPQVAQSSSGCLGRCLVNNLRWSLTDGGLQMLLRHGDRNSMCWSIESRVPFLNPDIAEFTLSLPESYLLSPEGETKRVFRAAMRGIVPDVILDRKDKIGFATPQIDWIRSCPKSVDRWLEYAEEIPFLNASRIQAESIQVMSGKKPMTSAFWRLINFCRWAELTLGGKH